MTKKYLDLFQKVSGWKTPDKFGDENYGVVTIETDSATSKQEAFLWDADMAPEHLNTMWLDGHFFVRRFTTA